MLRPGLGLASSSGGRLAFGLRRGHLEQDLLLFCEHLRKRLVHPLARVAGLGENKLVTVRQLTEDRVHGGATELRPGPLAPQQATQLAKAHEACPHDSAELTAMNAEQATDERQPLLSGLEIHGAPRVAGRRLPHRGPGFRGPSCFGFSGTPRSLGARGGPEGEAEARRFHTLAARKARRLAVLLPLASAQRATGSLSRVWSVVVRHLMSKLLLHRSAAGLLDLFHAVRSARHLRAGDVTSTTRGHRLDGACPRGAEWRRRRSKTPQKQDANDGYRNIGATELDNELAKL